MEGNKTIGDQIDKYLRYPLYIAVLFVMVAAGMFTFSLRAGYIMIGVTILYLIIIAVTMYKCRPVIMQDIVNYIFEQGQIQKQLLKELAIPYILVDVEGKILWYNQEFEDVTKKDVQGKKMIFQIFPELGKTSYPKKEEKVIQHVEYAAKAFRVELKRITIDQYEQQKKKKEEQPESKKEEQNNSIKEEAANTKKEEKTKDAATSMIAMYFYDETQLMSYQEEYENQKLVAGLVYIDNYDEVLESIEEVRRPLMLALIERKVSKYIQNIDGIVKKFEKDKYIIVFQQKYLEKLQELKFSILDEVRSINVGNDMAPTLSISLGVGADSFLDAYEYARMAMDLALGRGGDQAVIKEGEQISYYGGKTQVVEKSTRVKARVKAHALRELILTKDRVFVMGHKNPDVDSLGAAIGIYRLAKTMNKQAHIVVNNTNSGIKPWMNSLLENHSVYGDDLFITNEQALVLADQNAVLVVVDVNKPSLTECEELLDRIKTKVVLDHHRQTNDIIKNAVLSYVEPYASSASEMVTEILQYIIDKPKLKAYEADVLYSGILVDTDNFVTKAGVRTFEAAAYLRRSGADVTRVRKMFREDMEIYKRKAECVKNAQMYLDEFAISICPTQGVENPTILGAQIANELLDIVGIRASFVLTDLKEKIYISARSIDNLNVQVIMEKLGGGGHLNVAATQLTDCTVEQAKERLMELLKTMKEEGDL